VTRDEGGHSTRERFEIVDTNKDNVITRCRVIDPDTAHEVGHVLLTSAFKPVHADDPNNLMYPYSSNASRVPMGPRSPPARAPESAPHRSR
jgi:hypothetical protein